MGTLQDTYNSNLTALFAGQIAETGPNNLISRTVETAAIGFGIAVKQGTADNEVEAIDDGADTFVGITCRDQSQDVDNVDATPVGSSCLVMIQGPVAVTSGAAVNAGDPVYVIPASGKFTASASGNVEVPNATFRDSAAGADEIVVIRLK